MLITQNIAIIGIKTSYDIYITFKPIKIIITKYTNISKYDITKYLLLLIQK